MRLFVNDVLRRTFVHVGVRLELEQKVEDVDDEQDNAGSAADLERITICQILGSIRERGMKGGWQQQTHDAETKQAGAHLGDCAVVNLLLIAQAADEECHSQDEQEVTQNGAEQSSLYDTDFILGERDDEEDQLDSIPKRNVHQSTNRVTATDGYALGGMCQ